jgi:hypothetical protein
MNVRAFSLLVYTEQTLPTWLFLKKSRTSRRLTVQSRSENALESQPCQHDSQPHCEEPEHQAQQHIEGGNEECACL